MTSLSALSKRLGTKTPPPPAQRPGAAPSSPGTNWRENESGTDRAVSSRKSGADDSWRPRGRTRHRSGHSLHIAHRKRNGSENAARAHQLERAFAAVSLAALPRNERESRRLHGFNQGGREEYRSRSLHQADPQTLEILDRLSFLSFRPKWRNLLLFLKSEC